LLVGRAAAPLRKHVVVDGQPMSDPCSTSACTSSTTPSTDRGSSGVYLYLPKMEIASFEARLWKNDAFEFAQRKLGVFNKAR